MRLLFTSGPLYGHVNTLLPLALAAQAAGHDVAFATGPDLVPHVERHGLPAWPSGVTHGELGGSGQASWLAYFASAAARRVADLLRRAMAWRPDVVVHEETELAGAVVAAASGARQVVHGLGVMPSPRVGMLFLAEADALARRCGVERIGASLREATYLHLCPPSLQPAGERAWSNLQPLRPVAGPPAAHERLPFEPGQLPHRRTIHVTLGTVFHGATDVLAAAIEGLRALPFNLVVTVGPDGDPHRYGAQPPHVRIERYLPHALLLPHCALVVSHGGAGALFGALAHGLPQLVLPQGADQFVNADACVRAGAGLALQAAEVSPSAIHDAVLRLLDEPGFAAAARGIAAEIAAMPDATAVLQRLTRPPAQTRSSTSAMPCPTPMHIVHSA